MTEFELEAIRSRNRVDAGVPFLAIVQGDELLLDAPVPYSADERDRFADEGTNPDVDVDLIDLEGE